WFTVRPRDYLDRRAAGQSGIVRVQPRPPEYDPLIQAGQYEWESFLSEIDGRGQMILLPPNNAEPVRPESLPFSYFPVSVGAEERVHFQPLPWQAQVEPNLMLVFTNGSAGTATVKVDGQVVLDNRLGTPVTAVRLGALKPGEHTLDIRTTEPVSAYVNYLASTNVAYFQRFCTFVSSNALSFPYSKRDTNTEVLVLRIFSPI